MNKRNGDDIITNILNNCLKKTENKKFFRFKFSVPVEFKITEKNIRFFIMNVIFNLYFFSCLIIALTGNNLLWHTIMFMCAVIGIVIDKKYVLRNIIIPLSVCIITALVNMLFVHNMSPTTCALLILSWMMLIFIENIEVNTNMLQITSVAINMILLIRIILIGFAVDNVFKGISYNYISIYSLMPAVMYYFFSEKYKSEIKVMPAVITLIVCVLGRGRGGIITAAFLLICVLLKIYFSSKKNN